MNKQASKDFLGGERVKTGRDLVRHEFVGKSVEKILKRHGGPARPNKYDSVVIAGNGIGGLAFASRLARSGQFAGKVTVVAPQNPESRRLINGVSLRGHAMDYLGYALDATHADMLTAFAAGKRPTCFRQTTSMASKKNGKWSFAKPGCWQGGSKGDTAPIIYGARNTRVTGGMAELMDRFRVDFVDARVESVEQMRSLAKGVRPLLVNATTNPRLLGATPAKITRLVLAVQAPFKVKPGGIGHGPLESGTAYAPLIRRNGIINVGYFTPFSDPMSPESSWYGIFARVVDADSGFDKDAELAMLTEELLGVADAMGLEADDPDETLARALIPSAAFGSVPQSADGTLELKRAYYGGNPCYYADGMLSAAIGGVVAAEALIEGRNPDKAVRKALAPVRWDNFLFWLETTRITPLSEVLLRLSPTATMLYPHTTSRNRWKSAA